MGIVFRIEAGEQGRSDTALALVGACCPQPLQGEALAARAHGADDLPDASAAHRPLVQQQRGETPIIGLAMLGGDIDRRLEGFQPHQAQPVTGKGSRSRSLGRPDLKNRRTHHGLTPVRAAS